jgi:simple sugar transport system permease protein
MVTEPILISEEEGKSWQRTLSDIGNRVSVPIISILLAFLLGILTLYFLGYDPFFALYTITFGMFTPENLPDILFFSTPLIFTGLSVAVAFRAGMFNIGTEGQLYFGAFVTALVGFGLNRYFGIAFESIFSGFLGPEIGALLAAIIMIPLLMIVGAVGGALWALVPALLKARGVHEVITTIMMNYVALFLMLFFVGDITSPFTEEYGGGNLAPQTPLIASAGKMPTIFAKTTSDLHWGFVIGLLACVVIFILLWKTKIGYEARAVGYNPNAAKYGGISVPRTYIKVMLISGALGGLAGALEIMGFHYRFIAGFSAGYGFDGIAVALIGGNHPFGVIFGAILFGWLKDAGTTLQVNGIPRDVANTLKGVIVFFVAIPLLSKSIVNYLGKTKQGTWVKEELNNLITRIKNERISIIQTASVLIGVIIYLLIYSQIYSWIDIMIRTIIGLVFEIYIITPIYIIKPIISTIFFVLAILGYSWFRKKKYRNNTIRYVFIFTGIFLGFIELIFLIELFGQDSVLFALFTLILICIVYFEWLAREKRVKERITGEIPSTSYAKQIMIYSIISVIFLFLTAIITIFGSVIFPITVNLFIFTLDDYGTAIGIIGAFILIVSIIVLRKVTLPRDRSRVYFLPYILISLLIVFGLQTSYFIFETDPFLLISMTLSIAAPIGFAALGGMFSEKSGVVNIGLEGMILSGAFVAVWFTSITEDPWIGVLGAIIGGALMGLLHAIASIKYRANQVVVGVAINIVASAVTTLGLFVVWGVRGTSPSVIGIRNIKLPILKDIPIIGQFLYELAGGSAGIDPLVYLFIILIFLSAWIIQRTSFGLRVRAVGEHPRAADTLGIKVYQVRYICVVLSGVFAALGGAALTLGDSPIFRQNMSSGRGFVALAALIFGGWSPIGAALASLLFGFAYAFRFQLEAAGVGWIVMGLHLEKLTPTLPYLITIIAVAAIAKRMRPPAADGIPYVKEGG